jgi:hypothetical protein
MSTYPLSLEDILSWFRSKEATLGGSEVSLVGVRESRTEKSAAAADFDSAAAMGRISIWVSGEVDFEILRVSDGQTIYSRHESILTLSSTLLEDAFTEFARGMKPLPNYAS